jgi:hypothetical protein
VLSGTISLAAGIVHLREDCQKTTSDVEDSKTVGRAQNVIITLSSRNFSFSQLIYRPKEASANRETKSSELQLCTETQLNMICLRFTSQATHLPEDFRLAVEAMPKRE